MEGKQNRGEVTAELSEKVRARLCRENALVASEVWVDDARRVDFVAYRPHRPRDRSSSHATAAELECGTFTFVEVKAATAGRLRAMRTGWCARPSSPTLWLPRGCCPRGRPCTLPMPAAPCASAMTPPTFNRCVRLRRSS